LALARRLSTLSPVLALALLGCGGRTDGRLAVPAGAPTILCVNPASGASWTVALNEAGQQADGHAARFGVREISWSNPSDGGAYELDRASGALEITRASSTGGYVTFDRCKAAPVPGGRSIGASPRPSPPSSGG